MAFSGFIIFVTLSTVFNLSRIFLDYVWFAIFYNYYYYYKALRPGIGKTPGILFYSMFMAVRAAAYA